MELMHYYHNQQSCDSYIQDQDQQLLLLWSYGILLTFISSCYLFSSSLSFSWSITIILIIIIAVFHTVVGIGTELSPAPTWSNRHAFTSRFFQRDMLLAGKIKFLCIIQLRWTEMPLYKFLVINELNNFTAVFPGFACELPPVLQQFSSIIIIAIIIGVSVSGQRPRNKLPDYCYYRRPSLSPDWNAPPSLDEEPLLLPPLSLFLRRCRCSFSVFSKFFVFVLMVGVVDTLVMVALPLTTDANKFDMGQ